MNDLEQKLDNLKTKVAEANAGKPEFSLDDLIKAVTEEIRMRHNVYPRLIARGSKTQKTAERDIALMNAVLGNLQNQKDSQIIPTDHYVIGHRLLVEFHGLLTPARINNLMDQLDASFSESAHE